MDTTPPKKKKKKVISEMSLLLWCGVGFLFRSSEKRDVPFVCLGRAALVGVGKKKGGCFPDKVDSFFAGPFLHFFFFFLFSLLYFFFLKK